MRMLWMLLGVLVCCALAGGPARALDDIPSAGAGGPTDLRGYVRVAHLIPGTVPVDFFFDARRVRAQVGYGQASGYQVVMQRSYQLSVRPSGSGLAPVTQFGPVRVVSQFYYTLALVGTSNAPRVVQLYDDPGLPPRGQVRVRVLNAVQGTAALTVTDAQGQPLFANLGYGQVSDYRLLPRGAATYRALLAGATAPLATVSVPESKIRVYTVVIAGDPRQPATLRTLVLVERTE